MSDTPTTETVRDDYGWTGHDSYVPANRVFRKTQFDAWLAEHDRALTAERDRALTFTDTPSPCEMTHTPPFDFAHCETHDTTFPLGGACKWHGKDSISAVLEDETDKQRVRAIRAEIERDKAIAERDASRQVNAEFLAASRECRRAAWQEGNSAAWDDGESAENPYDPTLLAAAHTADLQRQNAVYAASPMDEGLGE